MPVSGIAATHHQKPGSCSTCTPSVPSAAAICPADSVTWRTSIGRPKKAASTGTMPSISPSETFAAMPEMFARHQRDQRCARSGPSQRTKPGFQAIALSMRWKTKAFSTQPAIRLGRTAARR